MTRALLISSELRGCGATSCRARFLKSSRLISLVALGIFLLVRSTGEVLQQGKRQEGGAYGLDSRLGANKIPQRGAWSAAWLYQPSAVGVSWSSQNRISSPVWCSCDEEGEQIDPDKAYIRRRDYRKRKYA